MANFTLSGFVIQNTRTGKAAIVAAQNETRARRISELDSIIAKHEESLKNTKKALDNLLQSPNPYYTFPFTNVKMPPEQAEMIIRENIEKFKSLIEKAEKERAEIVRLIQGSVPGESYKPPSTGAINVGLPYLHETRGEEIRAKASPAIVESSPITYKKYEEPPQEKGSMLLPIALAGGAALSAYLMFKG